MHILIEVLTFLVVLVVLILVHELGHFIVAKLSGMRVDEFGIGFPPRAYTIAKIGETEYTLNWLPFGGFVRIFGEDASVEYEGTQEDGGEVQSEISPRAFSAKPRIVQALVLLAGIFMNLVLAYFLIVASLVLGNQQEITYGQENGATQQTLAFAAVLPGGPAAQAGFMAGDEIKSATIITPIVGIGYNGTNPLGLITLLGTDASLSPVQFILDRNGKTLTLTATPKKNIIIGSPDQPAIGVAIVELGVMKTPLIQAPKDAAIVMWNMTKQTVIGLYEFFKGIVTFKADLSQVSGPVGIVKVVGQASATGFGQLLSLMALISINLAIINLLPIPALDGGRLLFVIIEGIIGRPLNPKIAGRVNMVGFVLLILLMVVVTGHDIFSLLH